MDLQIVMTPEADDEPEEAVAGTLALFARTVASPRNNSGTPHHDEPLAPADDLLDDPWSRDRAEIGVVLANAPISTDIQTEEGDALPESAERDLHPIRCVTEPPAPLTEATVLPDHLSPAAQYLAELAPSSQRVVRGRLNLMARALGVPPVTRLVHDQRDKHWEDKGADAQRLREVDVTCLYCNWGALAWRHTNELRAILAERFQATPSSANQHLYALRCVLHAAWRLGQMDAEAYYRARDITVIDGSSAHRGQALRPGQIELLVAACAHTPPTHRDYRDVALIAIAYATGLRRDELAHLKLQDYTEATGEILVVMGKGNKTRTTYLDDGAQIALKDWLGIRGIQPGTLFCPIDRWDHLRTDDQGRPLSMTSQAIYLILLRCGTAAKIAFTPHDLRRSHITHLLEAKVDIAVASKLAGHESVDTTAIYDMRGEEVKRDAVRANIHAPHLPRNHPPGERP